MKELIVSENSFKDWCRTVGGVCADECFLFPHFCNDGIAEVNEDKIAEVDGERCGTVCVIQVYNFVPSSGSTGIGKLRCEGGGECGANFLATVEFEIVGNGVFRPVDEVVWLVVGKCADGVFETVGDIIAHPFACAVDAIVKGVEQLTAVEVGEGVADGAITSAVGKCDAVIFHAVDHTNMRYSSVFCYCQTGGCSLSEFIIGVKMSDVFA